MYPKYFKRMFDFLCSLLAIILLSPIYLIIGLLVRINLGSPIIFEHPRPGKNERIFTVYKFRSMTNERDEKGELLPDSMRLTRFGKLLRATSLDELPELLNILMGDMSIVGPRPLEVYFLPYYNEQEKHRHDVRPGLTGLAQINGRNNLTWEQRFEYDLQYIKNISFINDLRILFFTLLKVLSSEGTDFPEVDFNVHRSQQRQKIESGSTYEV